MCLLISRAFVQQKVVSPTGSRKNNLIYGTLLSAMEIFLLITVLAVIQSLFGVGILLFGTPILLMMGLPYEDALLYLLPASAALSWSQVHDYKHIKLSNSYRRFFYKFCLPLLIGGMLLASHYDLKWEIRLFITIMLFIAFAIRTSVTLREGLQNFMRKNLRFALALMGLIHGLSNMGGSILSPLVSSLYKDKIQVLAGVSFDYAFMATIQLLMLTLVQGRHFEAKFLIGSVISFSVRQLIGKKIFAFTSDVLYQRLINGLILANALVLGIKFL